MAKRYSGDLVISITYVDRGDQYNYTISRKGQNLASDAVRPAPAGFGPGIGRDHPKAYDAMARSALSFEAAVNSDIAEAGEVDPETTGYSVYRQRPAKRNGRRARVQTPIRQTAVFYNVIRAEGHKHDRVYLMHRVGDPTGSTIRVPVVNGEPLVPRHLPAADQSAVMRAVWNYDDGDAKDNRRRPAKRSRPTKRNTAPVEYKVLSNRKKTVTIGGVRHHSRDLVLHQVGTQITYTIKADAYGRPYELPELPEEHRRAIVAALPGLRRR